MKLRLKHIYVLVFPVVFFGCNNQESVEQVTFNLPEIRITTENNEPVSSRTNYQNALFTIESEDIEGQEIEIRGRGNTKWTFPKKPFKIRFEDKTSLFGLLPAKSGCY